MKHKILFTFLGLLVLVFAFSIYIFFSWGEIPFLSKSTVKNVLIYPEDEGPSSKRDPVDLVFYFHGAGCDETFVFKSFALGGLNLIELSDKCRKDLVFISLGYNTEPHWSSPKAVRDTIKKISQLSKKFNTRKIILVGISMGGSLALNVISQSDENLKKKISGVISVFPIIDYEYTMLNTKRKNIFNDLDKHFSKYVDSKEQIKLSSPMTYVSKVPSKIKIILVEGTKDTHVCSSRIEDYYQEIKDINKENQLLKWEMDHKLEPVAKEFGRLIELFLS